MAHYQLLSDIYKKVFTTLYAHTQDYGEVANVCKLSYINCLGIQPNLSFL